MVWFFNLYMYLIYLQNPSLYQQLEAGGMSCWVQTPAVNLPVDGPGITGNIQPGCWYDPSNTNDGHARTVATKTVKGRR